MFHRHRWYIDYGHAGYHDTSMLLECAGCGARRPNVMRWYERCWHLAVGLLPGRKRREKQAIASATLAAARLNTQKKREGGR